MLVISRYDPGPAKTKIYPWRRDQKPLTVSYPYGPSKDWFLNSYGAYRWNRIRAAYWDNVIDENFVTDLYTDWRDTSEYFMLNGLDVNDNVQLSAFIKASKRGNDVYKERVRRKFSFFDNLPPLSFFEDDDQTKSTPVLFVTTTVDPKRYSLKEAWVYISEELNRFETLLRQKYGTFAKFRVWEAHESGYPHSHIIYVFHNSPFTVWEHFNKDNKRSWRISNKDRDAIKNMWRMGNVDIQGVQDTLGALSEVKKYVTKKIWNIKADKTNAMLTLFRKQSYWISTFNPLNQILPEHIARITDIYKRDKATNYYLKIHLPDWAKKDFVGSIWGPEVYLDLYERINERGLDNLDEPGASALVKQAMHNYNIEIPEIVRWEFVGFILGADLFSIYSQNSDVWVFGVKDPPPELYACVNFPDVWER